MPGCAIEVEDFIQAYYWAGTRLGFHLYMMGREHEHIPEANPCPYCHYWLDLARQGFMISMALINVVKFNYSFM
ncbi:MAG: hypothetical protein NHB14_25035 [Desulfosporosinus sp.]|nr:hypothetical protein [Desulfosporosinus sp.]